jgi:aminopeptidase N
MTVSVPLGYTVASNGNLDSVKEVSSEAGYSYQDHFWSDTTPIATFLINAVASIFVEYSE